MRIVQQARDLAQQIGFAAHALALVLSTAIVPAGARAGEIGFRGPDPGGETPKIVARIHVLRLDIFEPEELGALAPVGRLANAIHIDTREGVVRDLLIFGEESAVDPGLLQEAERVLRASGLFRTVDVTAYGAGDSVDVVVTTRDRWSTQAVVNYSTAGGEQELTIGGVETNFLGSGDVVSGVYRFSDVSNRASLGFRKRRFLGRHARAFLSYSEGDDGVYREIGALQPHYAEVARWSGGLVAAAYRGEVPIYDAGKESGTTRTRRDLAYGYLTLYRGGGGGLSVGGSIHLDDRVTRPLAGDAFEIGPLRSDRRRQVTLSVGLRARRFVVVRGADRTGDAEDLALGSNVRVALGMELAALGSSADRPYLELETEHSRRLAVGVYSALRARAWGHLRDGELEGRQLVLRGTLLCRRWRDHTQAARVLVSLSRGFAADELLYMGARAGLRGFRFRSFRGDRAVIANVEERIETGLAPLGIGLDLALFGDAGYAWRRSEAMRLRDVRTDVGVGLRVGAPTSSFPIRVDVARGLGPDGDWEVSIGTGQLFRTVSSLDFSPPIPRHFGPGLE